MTAPANTAEKAKHTPCNVAASLEAAANALNYAGAKREGIDSLLAARDEFLKLVEAAKRASATLSHIHNTVPLSAVLEIHALKDFQALDEAIARATGATP